MIAERLANELALSPSGLGFVSASYLLGMAAAQIPLGSLTDRYGLRSVQSVGSLIAAGGAIVFAVADSLPMVLTGRVLLGISTATAFTSGANAIALWFPAQRTAFATGVFVTLGTLGAVTATLPAQALVDAVGWRPVFVLLAVLSVLSAALTYLVVPGSKAGTTDNPVKDENGFGSFLTDRRFWKLAPVSATCIGTAWSLQSLWASPWLAAVEGLDQTAIGQVLFAMALALSVASLAFGAVAGSLQRLGIGLETLLGSIFLLFLAAQLAAIIRLPIPVVLPWVIIAAIGSATVVSYAILATYFPRHSLGRANAALNLCHLLVAFAVQGLIGVVIDTSPVSGSAHHSNAYQLAFALILAIEGTAFVWFVVPAGWMPWRRSRLTPPAVLAAHPVLAEHNRFGAARLEWNGRLIDADRQLRNWRLAALASMTVLFVLATLAVPLDRLQTLATLTLRAPEQPFEAVR